MFAAALKIRKKSQKIPHKVVISADADSGTLRGPRKTDSQSEDYAPERIQVLCGPPR